MGLITSKLHAVLDYLIALLFIATPFVMGFPAEGKESWIMFGAGILIISYSLFTNYEGGIKKVIPMQAQLAFDGFIGLFVAFSPWVFGFSDNMYLVHLITGLILAFSSILTIVPEDKTDGPRLYPHHHVKRYIHGKLKRGHHIHHHH
jgi:hypothetical protein